MSSHPVKLTELYVVLDLAIRPLVARYLPSPTPVPAGTAARTGSRLRGQASCASRRSFFVVCCNDTPMVNQAHRERTPFRTRLRRAKPSCESRGMPEPAFVP